VAGHVNIYERLSSLLKLEKVLMAALTGSNQPFPLRQISLNDLLNADISSIVTSLSQPNGKRNGLTCSNLLLEGSLENVDEWDPNQSATELPAVFKNEISKVGTHDLQHPTIVSSTNRTLEDGGIIPNFSARSVRRRAWYISLINIFNRC
jgi:hypothetical protein